MIDRHLPLHAASPASSGRLAAAHRGYAYQDLLSAYVIALALARGHRAVTVDKKVVSDDRFDDLEVHVEGIRIRRQLKHSTSEARSLEYADFNGASSSLRFDRLVRTFLAQEGAAADEYRLCVTWQVPASSDALAILLDPCDLTATVGGASSRIFRLSAERVWPLGGVPRFTCLTTADVDVALTRAQVVDFCARFVIECQLPAASLDLDDPGSLERSLLDLLTTQIGIGRYPNADRHVRDVAALAIHTAATARAAGATLAPHDIARRLGVRTDYGRIAQAFPLDRAVLQPREVQRQRLVQASRGGGKHVLLAGPGAGKSWALTQIADDLARMGHIVARHYCFLEPGDELLEQRVISDVFFGNLLGELDDALAGHGEPRAVGFAAGPKELEQRVADATAAGLQVVLIIDGLDHIARVRSASAHLSDDETDIVEHLAALELPPQATLVIGSQPGDHLAPLREAFGDTLHTHTLVPWSTDEIAELAASHGLMEAYDKVRWANADERRASVALLAERSEGNPLYARYLIRGLIAALTAGHAADPRDWLHDAPVIEGDIARYYEHLYARASYEAKPIADLMGMLDFAVTAAELIEMTGPLLGEWVPEALVALTPILSQATAQGGVRIFHESFRRFMLDKLRAGGRSVSSVLAPVITWLEHRDFYADAKSYRFLLPLLRRAGRDADVLQKVSLTFVRDSILGGHTSRPIEENLLLAAGVAARQLDWVALARCSELLRSVEMCFEEGTNNWEDYWRTFQAIHGPEATVDRLLFDGRPTLDRDEGLVVCAAIDAAGAVAPWKEYLALPVDEEHEKTVHAADRGETLTADETVGLAAIRGRLRLGQTFRIVRRMHAHLCDADAEATNAFVRRLGSLFAAELSVSLVANMARRADGPTGRRYRISAAHACALLLGVADFFGATRDTSTRDIFATAALEHARSPEEAMRCVERGAPSALALVHAEDPAVLAIGLESSAGVLDAAPVRRWMASIRLHGHGPAASEVVLAQQQRATGPGWYRCWLRFVLATALTEAAQRHGQASKPADAFAELNRDMRPFSGTPRACDLYSIRQVINESLDLSLSLLSTQQEWAEALPRLLEARRRTETRMDREDGGPIMTSDLFSVLMKFAGDDAARAAIDGALEDLLGEAEDHGTYYSWHAQLRLHSAMVRSTSGWLARASEHWQQAIPFLLGYGFHKDTALFDVIVSAPALATPDVQPALRALVALQPAVSAALRHTDGRGTRNLPNAWFRALLAVDPVHAIDLLCRTYGSEPGSPSWLAQEALADTVNHLMGTADPLLLDALWTTARFEVGSEGESERLATERLAPLEILLATHPGYARERFIRLCAEVADDTGRYREGGLAAVRVFAMRHALPWTLPPATADSPTATRVTKPRSTPRESFSLHSRPAFTPNARVVDLVAGIRALLQQSTLDSDAVVALITPLGYYLSQMHERGETGQAQRLIHLLASETSLWSAESVHPLPLIAQCLENGGWTELAVRAYTLASTSARGQRIWLPLGGSESSRLLQRAAALDADLAKVVLSHEIARMLRGGQYNGISRYLVQQLANWDDPRLTIAVWHDAFAVLNSRLPLPGDLPYFGVLDPLDRPSWSVNEALATLLVLRISDPLLLRKKAALSAFHRLLAEHPALFIAPLQRAMSRDTTVSSLQLILQAILDTSVDVSDLVTGLEGSLRAYASSPSWTVSVLASNILTRAGMPVPTRHAPRLEAVGTPRPAGLATIGLADRDELLTTLASRWPLLPARLACRLSESTFFNDAAKEIANDRWELERGRSRDAVPPAAVMNWPTELFTAALDEVLIEFAEPSAGEQASIDQDIVLACVLPSVPLQTTLEASRVPRPAWPAAQAVRDGVHEIQRVPETDALYPGWVRLAWHETSFYRKDGLNHRSPDHRAFATAAVIGVVPGRGVPPEASPMLPAPADQWWEDPDASDAMDQVHQPQMVSCEVFDDCLGRGILLIPPAALRLTLALSPSPVGAPLRWHDPSGAGAVVLRTWRTSADHYTVESHKIVGSDLLVRPDVFTELTQLHGRPLKELCRQVTTALPDPER